MAAGCPPPDAARQRLSGRLSSCICRPHADLGTAPARRLAAAGRNDRLRGDVRRRPTRQLPASPNAQSAQRDAQPGDHGQRTTQKPAADDAAVVSDSDRANAIARAQVWRQPRTPIARATLATDVVTTATCRFKMEALGGTTPKFDCVLPSGDEIRAKYGKGPEIPAEAAATRLLAALGFGADTITLIERLRCYGCPAEPFSTMKVVEATRRRADLERMVDRLQRVSRLRMGGARAQVRATADRDQDHGGRLGVLRARRSTPAQGRRAARPRRRAAADGRLPGALGQQVREPAPGVSLRGVDARARRAASRF